MAMILDAEITRLLDGRNFAHLATLMPDGSPHSAPVWIGREGNRLIICTDEGSVKARNTARDPRVAISILDLQDPYSEAQLRGRVIERRRDSDFTLLDGISRKYVGKPPTTAKLRLRWWLRLIRHDIPRSRSSTRERVFWLGSRLGLLGAGYFARFRHRILRGHAPLISR